MGGHWLVQFADYLICYQMNVVTHCNGKYGLFSNLCLVSFSVSKFLSISVYRFFTAQSQSKKNRREWHSCDFQNQSSWSLCWTFQALKKRCDIVPWIDPLFLDDKITIFYLLSPNKKKIIGFKCFQQIRADMHLSLLQTKCQLPRWHFPHTF